MKTLYFKRVFIVVMSVLLFVCIFLSDMEGWGAIIGTILVYFYMANICYSYVFKKDIVLAGATLTLENPYLRMLTFLTCLVFLVSMVLDLLGYVDLFDSAKMEKSMRKLMFMNS
ncbi:hypothetical protein [Marinomonas sp.]|uniref:hypothetical protein n=1 Tax=Marinomonas sp. TaxID=1904862 RepID=UPI003BABEAF9